MIEQTDLINFSRLMKVIQEGHFDLEGKAVVPVALLIKWYEGLGQKLNEIYIKQEDVKKSKEAPSIKKIGSKKV